MANSNSQRGATIITFALMLVLLLGIVGFALDFSRLYIVKSELQTAMDSCALAAAQELDGKVNARDRARKAGVLAGNLNAVNLQSATWDGQAKLSEADVELLDASMGTATSDAQAQYVRCNYSQGGVDNWLFKVMALRAVDNVDDDDYPAERSVFASAIATRGSAQSTCPLPVGLIVLPTQEGPDYGLTTGQWVVALKYQAPASPQDDSEEDLLVPGEMGWFNLDGSQNAQTTIDQLSEGNYCGTSADPDRVITPGAKLSAADQWNYRFGIYPAKDKEGDRAAHRPDLTGFAYTSDKWTKGESAYQDFLSKRAIYSPYTGKFSNKYKTASTSLEHQAYGYNRRIVLVPVLSFMGGRDYRIIDFACMLLLGPMKIYKEDVHMEYLGNAAAENSPCTSGGKPGGTTGPLVPTLVR